MSTPAPHQVQVTGDGIVGRKRELAKLRMWLDAAGEGAGRLVLCVGEPGINEVLAQLGEEPDGLEARYAGAGDDGTVRVVSCWESKAHADRFVAERLGPALAPEPLGTPEGIGIEVTRTYVR